MRIGFYLPQASASGKNHPGFNPNNMNKKLIFGILFASIATLICFSERTPIHRPEFKTETIREFNLYYNGVVSAALPGPYAYRILVPYAVYGIASVVPVSPIDIDFVLKFFLLLFCQIIFHSFLRSYLGEWESFAGVLLLDLLLLFSLSYIHGPSVLETGDIANALVFISILLLLHQNKFVLLCAVAALGMLNRETPIALVPVVFLQDRFAHRGWHRSAILLLILGAVYLVPRLLIESPSSNWFLFEGIPWNIPFVAENFAKPLVANVRLLVLLGPLLLLAFSRFQEQPVFFKHAAILVPIFLLVHYVLATIIEARLWMPLFVVLIPMAMHTLSGLMKVKEQQ